MRLPLYSIPPDAYLFAAKLAAHGGPNEKEEPVRQWCAFELIRAYGLTVSDLSFEEEVRVGSKTYRIDILVKRNGLPWLVVECKEPQHKKHEDGLAQAISYAGSVNVSAEYAVYTNGTAWQVKRRVDGDWTAVPDIPVSGPARPLGSIDELLLTVELVSPLLHKLDEPLSSNEARVYLEALQRFFHGPNLIAVGVDHDLRFAADNLLRVISTDPKESDYCHEKLTGAARYAEIYRAKTGDGFPLPEPRNGESVFLFMPSLSASIHSMLETGQSGGGLNRTLLRMFLALLSYGREQAHADYPPLPAYLHTELRNFLAHALSLSLDVRLPDALEEKFTSDLKHYTRPAWNDLMGNEVREPRRLGPFQKIWHTLRHRG